LNTLIKLDTKNYLEKLEEIADVATKQFNIENILEKMYADWKTIECDIKFFKDTGTYILGGSSVDEIN
jgi:dynein heavy chain, axonemal